MSSLAYAPSPAPLTCPCCTTAQPVLFYDGPRAAIIADRLLLFSRQEYALLRALCAAVGVQSCTDLAVLLHAADDAITPAAVRVLVCRLRRKLADRGVLGMVKTVRAQGYVVSLACLATDWQPPA